MAHGYVSRQVFLYLAFGYAAIIALSALGIIYKYTLHFELFALILGVVGFIAIAGGQAAFPPESKKIFYLPPENKKTAYLVFGIALLIIAATRILPYAGNSVLLGYDPGIYMNVMEQYFGSLSGNTSLPTWLNVWAQPVLFIFSGAIFTFWADISGYLLSSFIFFELLLGVAIFVLVKAYFNEEAAAFSALFYSVSIPQFSAYGLFYYNNVAALAFLALAFTLIRKEKFYLAGIAGGLIAGMHRPTILIYALVFFAAALSDRAKAGKYIVSAAITAIVGLLFYLQTFEDAIINVLLPSVSDPTGGTFINFFTYEFQVLPYIPFALLALFIF